MSNEAEQFLAMLRFAPAGRSKLEELTGRLMEVQHGHSGF
jgi:hypothetical protein